MLNAIGLFGMNYTQFQIETRDALQAALSDSAALKLREVAGRTESFLKGVAGPVKIWIYEDGAEVQTAVDEYRFESQDFDSLSELRNAFVARAVTVIDGTGQPAPPDGV